MSDENFSAQDFDALLDEFISKQLADTEEDMADLNASSTPQPSKSEQNTSSPDTIVDTNDPAVSQLAEEELRLYNSYQEFIKSASRCGENHNIPVPEFAFSGYDLLPRFRPNRTEALKQDISLCWDIILKAEPEILSKLPANSSDEQILDFAEKISAPDLQLSLISYVETLIEIDACETAYNMRKIKYQKHKIEKELYEEHQRIINKKRLYAQALREKNFPIDPDLLVNNYFKTATKDPLNAPKILEQNPATFAPIQIDKIPNHFFGLIKPGPNEGKAVNKKLGKFLSNLKV